jgi:hypothetical protein
MHEYAQEIRSRYFKAKKEEKGRMLDEFTRVTGLHRKAAIRLLSRRNRTGADKRSGRPRRYGAEAAEALKYVWEASDRLCSKRLQPFLPEMVKALSAHAELRISKSMEEQLYRMSPSTIDRLLKPYRQVGGRKPVSTTRAGSLLKRAIPIRTFADWEENRPGFMEVDLVAHCGENTEGFYLSTLSAVDVDSGWTECLPVWGKQQMNVRQAVHRMRQRLPIPLLGIDSDNGGEFINRCLYDYCCEEGITFTRSRSYKKNDSCHVEQKNGNVVRRLVGYDRYSSKAALECLGKVYDLVRLYVNFFQPTMKLISKTRNGARVRKVYDTAQTPYRRLVRSGVLTEEKKAEMAATYSGLNPVQLLSKINSNLEKLWRLAERPGSVTGIMTH